MRLSDAKQKIKQYPDLPKDIFVVLLICLIALGSFIAGQYATIGKLAKGELRIVDNRNIFTPLTKGSVGKIKPDTIIMNPTTSGMFVGSITGKIYHLPWCSGAKRIREENKIWFASVEDAVARGYSPASNCKGI